MDQKILQNYPNDSSDKSSYNVHNFWSSAWHPFEAWVKSIITCPYVLLKGTYDIVRKYYDGGIKDQQYNKNISEMY